MSVLPILREFPDRFESERLLIRAPRPGQAHADFLAHRDLRLHLYLREDGTFVGSSGLHRIDWAVPRLEIGYWLRTSMAGRGFATEATRRIADFAFADLGAERVEIWCDARNERSASVATRAGFTSEARLNRNHRDTSGNSPIRSASSGCERHDRGTKLPELAAAWLGDH